ncbi:hypothetical protein ABIB68_008309 [Bradyrhizobium sp. F1.2.2]
MRCSDEQPGSLFSYVDLEIRVCRVIRYGQSGHCERGVGRDVAVLHPLYAEFGRPSIAPEKLVAVLLQAFCKHPLGTATHGAIRV